jgi:hypothetical protein
MVGRPSLIVAGAVDRAAISEWVKPAATNDIASTKFSIKALLSWFECA